MITDLTLKFYQPSTNEWRLQIDSIASSVLIFTAPVDNLVNGVSMASNIDLVPILSDGTLVNTGGLYTFLAGCYRITLDAAGMTIPVGGFRVFNQSPGPIYTPNGFAWLADGDVLYVTVDSQSPMLWSTEPCCVAAGTKVLMENGSLKPIEQVRRGDVVRDFANRPVKVIENSCAAVPCTEFVQVMPGATVGNREALLIRRGHPMLVRGQEVECQMLTTNPSVARKIVLDREVPVYTLVTDRRTFVNMQQGACVATWGADSWFAQQ
jgi:hypothetical protein